MRKFFEIIFTSLKMALEEFRLNKLRTFLSLFGITIGIFCIIAVLAAVNSLKRNIENDINAIGTNSIFIDRWEYKPSSEWWKLIKRPPVTYDEMKMLQARVTSAEHIAFKIDTRQNVEYEDNMVSSTNIYGFTNEYPDIQTIDLQEGRMFQQSDYDQGSNVAVIGYAVAEQLFVKPESALGKQVEIKGKKCTIVGLMKKQGKSIINIWEFDDSILMPFEYLRTMVQERTSSPVIIVKAFDNVSTAQVKDELTAAMRSIRKLKPREEDDYTLNDIEPMREATDSLFAGVNIGGWAIAGLSLIVGMFGVANIMFVTVRERTSQIGLKKAIGAKRRTIMLEFLMESAFLCIMGGAIGLLLVFILTKIISSAFDFQIYISLGIMGLAVAICIIIGMLAGIIPASIAAKLDPVVAIRTT